MTYRTVEVVCPECDKLDVTNVEIDEEENDYYVNTRCVDCTNPYAIRIELHIIPTAYRLVKGE